MSLSKSYFLVLISGLSLNACEEASLTIRASNRDDLPHLHSMLVKSFAGAYGTTAEAQMAVLRERCNEIIKEESQKFNETVSAVALQGDTIIGFLAFNATTQAGQYYGKLFAVDPSCQKQGVGKQLVKNCLSRLPNLQSIVLMTGLKNENAQRMYERYKGVRCESPAWAAYLYSYINPKDYVGYKFDDLPSLMAALSALGSANA